MTLAAGRRAPYRENGTAILQRKLLRGGANMIETNIQILPGNDDHRFYHALTFYPVTAYERIAAQFISNIHLGILLLDQNRKVVEMNQAASRFLGIERRKVLHRSLEEWIPLLPLAQPQFTSLLIERCIERKQIEMSWEVGELTQHLSITVNPVTDHKQSFAGVYVVIQDITELCELRQQVRQDDRLVILGQIAAATAHEIRNPLTSIKGFLQMIGDRLREKKQQKERSYIDLMLKEISRINNLIGEFLLLSRPRHARLGSVSLTRILKEILPIIKNEAILHNVDLKIERRLSSLPLVLADGELLKQVFLNLCKNAIEAMGEGGELTIRFRIEELARKLVVHIIDAGPGISGQMMGKIFEPFFTTKENGTGLGLSVCRQIIHEIGGLIEVSSCNMGTTFRVHLPLAQY
jgi:two-component system, sporulation sensor kinase E